MKKREQKQMSLACQEARERLLSEINRTQLALETAYSNFENVSDPDLVDCYIYEMNAIQFRYKYLMKQMKEFESKTKSMQLESIG